MPDDEFVLTKLDGTLVFANARIWAGPEDGVRSDAIAFADGRIGRMGRRDDVLAGVGKRVRLVDCGGRWIVPGFVDAHVHVRAAASASASLDLSSIRSQAELLNAIHDAAVSRPPGWLSFAGLQLDDIPSPQQVQAAAPRHRVRIRHRSLHAWLLSTNAASAAGIPGDVTGWRVDHDGTVRRRFGRITGPAAFEDALARWSRARLSEGVTTVVDATVTNGPEQLAAVDGWHRRGVLLQRPAALVGLSHLPIASELPVAGAKIMLSTTADTRAELEVCLRRVWASGLQAAVHCADLETLGTLLDVLVEWGGPRAGLRIEHAAVCPPEWVDAIARARASIVTQPAFVHAHGDRYLADPSLAPHDWLYRLQTWRRHGIQVAVGLDAPAGPADPLIAFRAAVSRRTEAGRALGPKEAMDRESALAAMTAWAADVSRLPDVGRLRPGLHAAAVVLDGDPFHDGARDGIRVRAVVSGTALLWRGLRDGDGL